MAFINHPLSVTAVKAFAWPTAKKGDCLNRFNVETGPGASGFESLRKDKT